MRTVRVPARKLILTVSNALALLSSYRLATETYDDCDGVQPVYFILNYCNARDSIMGTYYRGFNLSGQASKGH